MADPKIGGASLTRAELREEFDRFRDEMHRELRHYATKADVANLKTWMVGLLLVVQGGRFRFGLRGDASAEPRSLIASQHRAVGGISSGPTL